MRVAQPGDLVLLVSSDKKRFIVRLVPGESLHTHRGMVAHDHVLGAAPGATVLSHLGAHFTLLWPSWDELLLSLPRSTQIIYPKDIGLILFKLGIAPGTRVVEAGSGSGILTTALARYVTPGGHVYSYDARADMLEKAQANVRRAGLEDSVTFRQRTIEIGFEEDDADALFLDVREPQLYLAQAAAALCQGGFFGAIVPTMNQVVELIGALARQPFTDVEILELLERHYKALPERIRPLDRLSAHTGFLVFARRLTRRPAVREELPMGAPDDPPPVPQPDPGPED